MNADALKRHIDHCGLYRHEGYPSEYLELQIAGKLSRMQTGDEVRVQGNHYLAIYRDNELNFERVR
jgi:hypothetical protein